MYQHPLINADTTLIWVDFWNVTFKAALEAALTGSGNSNALSAFLKNGRIIDASATEGAAELPASPSLTFIIPDGTRVVLDGVLHTADGDQVISADDHPNFDGWTKYSITYDVDSESWLWDATWHETKPAAGSGIIGKIVTNSITVESIDASEDESDVIPSLPLLLQRINDAGGGEGSGGVSQADFDALSAQMAEVLERLAELEAATGTGTTTTVNTSPHEMTRRSMVLASQANDRVDDFKDYPGSLFIRDVTGSGEETSVQTMPDVRDGGEWES